MDQEINRCKMFGQGILTKVGVTKVLESLGANKEDAEAFGKIAGMYVSVLTLDPVSITEGIANWSSSLADSADIISES